MLAHRHSSLDTAGSRSNSRQHRSRDITPRKENSKDIVESNPMSKDVEDSHVAQHEITKTPTPMNLIRMDAVAQ